MNVAIICQSIKYYAGTERVVYELYTELQRRGIDVHLGTAELGDFYYNELYPARVNDIPGCMDDTYDIIINFHSSTFAYLFPKGVKTKNLIYFSLSPYEPIEFPFFQSELIDKVLANSAETRDSLISQGIEEKSILVFPNSHNFDCEYKIREESENLKRIIVVSNHIPEELRSAILLAPEIEFTTLGIEDNVKFIDVETLSEFDAVISIGYTVVTAVQARRPVYIYDHFGGDGWLSKHTLEKQSYYNFSGRPEKRVKSAEEIIVELKNGYDSALGGVEQLYQLMKLERNIVSNVECLLSEISEELSFKQPNSYLVNISNAYFKLYKMNQNLQDIVSNNKIESGVGVGEFTERLEGKLDVIKRDQKLLIIQTDGIASKVELLESQINVLSKKKSGFLVMVARKISNIFRNK